MSLRRTPIIVVERIHYLTKDMWLNDVNEIKNLVTSWSKSWENENIKGYISHYDPVKFHSPTHGKLSKYRAYKKAVFRGKGKPKINVGHLTIFRENDYLKVSFSQHYQSERLNDIGEKLFFNER